MLVMGGESGTSIPLAGAYQVTQKETTVALSANSIFNNSAESTITVKQEVATANASETVSITLKVTLVDSGVANVDEYTISNEKVEVVGFSAQSAQQNNYNFIFSGTITVVAREISGLSAKTDDASKAALSNVYGETVSDTLDKNAFNFTVDATGLANANDLDQLALDALTFTKSTTANSSVGSHAVTATLQNSNFKFVVDQEDIMELTLDRQNYLAFHRTFEKLNESEI